MQCTLFALTRVFIIFHKLIIHINAVLFWIKKALWVWHTDKCLLSVPFISIPSDLLCSASITVLHASYDDVSYQKVGNDKSSCTDKMQAR